MTEHPLPLKECDATHSFPPFDPDFEGCEEVQALDASNTRSNEGSAQMTSMNDEWLYTCFDEDQARVCIATGNQLRAIPPLGNGSLTLPIAASSTVSEAQLMALGGNGNISSKSIQTD